MQFFIFIILCCTLCVSCTKETTFSKAKKEKSELFLTDEEITFALQLTEKNREVFLQKFSAIERAKTIYFFSTHPKEKTANEAVELYFSKN